MGLLLPALPFHLLLQSLPRMSDSDYAFPFNSPLEIHQAVRAAEPYIQWSIEYYRTFQRQFGIPTAQCRTTPCFVSQASWDLTLQTSLFDPRAAAPTLPSTVREPSVQYIRAPDSAIPALCHVHGVVALSASTFSSSIIVLTAGSYQSPTTTWSMLSSCVCDPS